MNDLGITGLATGMDTESTIKKIMKYEQAPLNKLKQQQQLLIWKQEAYRSQNTSLDQLRDTLSNLRLESTYNSRKVTSSNSNAVTAVTTPNAASINYAINVERLATVASNTSQKPLSIRSAIVGNFVDLTAAAPIVIGQDDPDHPELKPNHSFQIKLDDGTYQTIQLSAQTYDGTAGHGLVDLAADIQTQLNTLYPTTPVYVKATDDHELMFYTTQNSDGSAHTLELKDVDGDATLQNLGFQTQSNSKALVGSIFQSPSVAIDSNHNQFMITLGTDSSHLIKLDTTNSPKTYSLEEFAAQIQNKINAIGGSYANIKVAATNYHQLKFSDASDQPATIKLDAGPENDMLNKMGFSGGTMSDYPKKGLNPSTPLWNQKDQFMNSSYFKGKDEKSQFGFTINGQNFTFTYSNSLQDIINAINGNSNAGVAASYDVFTDTFNLTSTKYGDNHPGSSEILVGESGDNRFLSQLLNIDPSKETGGTNAVLTINGAQTQKTDNTFTMNGTTFTLTGTGYAAVNVLTDTSGVSDKVQAFVDKYNQVITGLNEQINQSRAVSNSDKYSYYLPLTDDQKKAMSEDEVTAWEKKAKEGLLHNDTILRDSLSEMRTNLSQGVQVPLNIQGSTLSGSINLIGNNHLQFTAGSQTREITLKERNYNPDQYNLLVGDLQQQLDNNFGTNVVKVSLDENRLTFATQNIAMKVNTAAQNNGLNLLGLSSGSSVNSKVNTLAQIGITTGNYTENGKLNFNKSVFEDALAKDPQGVIDLLTKDASISSSQKTTKRNSNQDPQNGIFYRLYYTISDQMKRVTNEAGASGTYSHTNELGKQLTQMADRISTAQERLNQEESRLYRTFNKMESSINHLNAQSSKLGSMLGTGGGAGGSQNG